MDREKVINALEVVRKGYAYKKNGKNVISLDVRFVDMVLALLKEQEHKDRMFHALEDDWKRLKELLKEQEAKTQGGDSGMCEICSFYERALPVKPEKEHSGSGVTWWNVCGNCKTAINPNDKFCHECGRPVLWESR